MNLTGLSKFISLILRHNPQVIGIELDEHGWADVEELLAGINKTRNITMDMLEEIEGVAYADEMTDREKVEWIQKRLENKELRSI